MSEIVKIAKLIKLAKQSSKGMKYLRKLQAEGESSAISEFWIPYPQCITCGLLDEDGCIMGEFKEDCDLVEPLTQNGSPEVEDQRK